MKLARIRYESRNILASVTEEGYIDVSRVIKEYPPLTGIDDLCACAADRYDAIQELRDATEAMTPLSKDLATLLAPTDRPSKIIGAGLNYKDHCRETGTAVPAEPIIFAKLPSAIIGPGEAIQLHREVTSEVDWEVELVAVVGERVGPTHRGTLSSILGYTIGNDISARDIQRDNGQWMCAKSLTTFCPLGPAMVTSDEITDPQLLNLGLDVNGIPQQCSTTAEMIFNIEELIDWITRRIALLPGDLIFTGTPHGTGAFQTPPKFLKPGDIVDAWIEGIGVLRNPVKASDVTGDMDLQ